MLEIKNKLFINIIVAYLIIHLCATFYDLLFAPAQYMILVRFVIAGTILYAIFKKYKYLVVVLKIWSGVIILGQVARLVAGCSAFVHIYLGGNQLSPEYYSVSVISMAVYNLTFGLYCLLKSNESIVWNEEIQNCSYCAGIIRKDSVKCLICSADLTSEEAQRKKTFRNLFYTIVCTKCGNSELINKIDWKNESVYTKFQAHYNSTYSIVNLSCKNCLHGFNYEPNLAG